MKLSEAAKEVISLADVIRAYWEVELPRRHPKYPFGQPGEDSGPPPPEERRLSELLSSLPEDVVYQLILLTYLGREYFGTDDLAGELRRMKDMFPTTEFAISWLMAQVPLADDLIDGLERLKTDGIDPDSLIPVGASK